MIFLHIKLLCNAFGQSSGVDYELLAIKGNETTNISKRDIKIQDHEIDNLVCWGDGNVFSSDGSIIYYSDRGSNNVFEIKEGKLVLYSSLDFGKYAFPSDNNISFFESTNYSNDFPY
ncbi:MAG: hypothetical protein RR202_03310 [Bacteroidales bacterium]